MISIFVRTLIVYVLLSVSLKIMGKRQIGELDVSELVSTLLISEIAAIPIDDPSLPLMNAIIPTIFIMSLEIIVSYVKTKHNKLKKYIEGDSVFLIYKSEVCQETLRESRISINEFLAEMRNQGIGDIREIDYALLEQNGKISILKKGGKSMAHPLIIDGVTNRNELSLLNLSEDELKATLSECGIDQSEIFLLTLNDKSQINIIRKKKK